MKKKLFLTILCVLLLSGAALADWVEEDGHKMHYPQLPDPSGWDVLATENMILADDWQCSGSGPVSDIHFWGSWFEDIVGGIENVHLSIHSDDRSGSFSMPGELLWQIDVPGTQVSIKEVSPSSQQGWFNPSNPSYYEDNHTRYFQYNIVDIPDPFLQQEGTIYWLDISVTTTNGLWGWKTSGDHFEDDAVWWNEQLNRGEGGWLELIDPLDGQTSLDLAFVIIPEPATILTLGLGFALIFRRKK